MSDSTFASFFGGTAGILTAVLLCASCVIGLPILVCMGGCGAIVGIGGIGAKGAADLRAIREREDAAARQDEPAPDTAGEPATELPSAPIVSDSVTMANFSRITTGMTFSEVRDILGDDHELLSENDIAGTKTAMYAWKSKTSFGGNCNVMFQNGTVVQKAQFGLK